MPRTFLGQSTKSEKYSVMNCLAIHSMILYGCRCSLYLHVMSYFASSSKKNTLKLERELHLFQSDIDKVI